MNSNFNNKPPSFAPGPFYLFRTLKASQVQSKFSFMLKIILSSLFLVCFSPAHAALTDGLVAYYCFDDATNIGKDCSTNGNNGSPIGKVNSVAGWKGNAASFGGYKNPASIHIPNSSSLQFSSDATISFAVNMTGLDGMDGWGSYANYGVHAVVAKSHDRRGFIVNVSGNNKSQLSSGAGSFEWGNNGIGATTENYQPGQWRYFTYVFSNSTHTAKLYADGLLIKTSNTFNQSFNTANSQDLYLGKFSDSWYPLNGVLDDVRIYNRALTATEVTALYQQGQNNTSTITDVSPKTTVIGSPTVFTVTGTDLIEGMGFTVGDCEFSNRELAGGTATKRQFLCTQYGTKGNKIGLVKTAPGGTTLLNFTVQAKADSIPEIYAATDKKELTGSDEIVSVLLSTTVQNQLNTSSLYDLYVKFTLPDGTVLYDDGNQLVSTKTPFFSNSAITQPSDWSDLLQYSLGTDAPSGTYIADVELWSKTSKVALSTSATVFDYFPAVSIAPGTATIKSAATIADQSDWLIKRNNGFWQMQRSRKSATANTIDPTALINNYKRWCNSNPTSATCLNLKKKVMALQMGTKYFDKIPGIDGIQGAYGIFKKGEALVEKYTVDEINSILDSYYWDYQNNSNLTSEQKFLLTAMKLTDLAIGGKMTKFVKLSDIADSLVGVLEKIDKQRTLIANADATAYDVNFNVSDNCYTYGCDMKSFEITPIFTLALPNGSTGFESIPLSDYVRTYTNETNIASLTKTKTGIEPSPGYHDYYFKSLQMGLYMVTVRYVNGDVYRQPIFVDKTNETYSVTTAHE